MHVYVRTGSGRPAGPGVVLPGPGGSGGDRGGVLGGVGRPGAGQGGNVGGGTAGQGERHNKKDLLYSCNDPERYTCMASILCLLKLIAVVHSY